MNCIVCDNKMDGPYRGYWYACPNCDFLCSNLSPTIGVHNASHAIDEAGRRKGLEHLRRANFEDILDFIDRCRQGNHVRLLDVGCAHGWFLQAARERNYKVAGIEPDPSSASLASPDLNVITGYFPDMLPKGASFDLICFNDVLEHLPDPRAIADACFDRLAPNGLLIVNLPSSQGVLFQICRALARVGIGWPIDRMWQRGLPSPHLTYFHPVILARLLGTHGFRELHRRQLPAIQQTGLWARLRCDEQSSAIKSGILWISITILSPLLKFLPSDATVQIFQKELPTAATNSIPSELKEAARAPFLSFES